MTGIKKLDHELNDAELDLQAQRWAEQAEARLRQKSILDARKKEWRNAPPQATGLKPFTDVWSDVEAQSRGAITEDQFWEQVIRTIHEEFFDEKRKLLYFFFEETRVTSKTFKEVGGIDESDCGRPLMYAIVRNSWATIETLGEWAWHARYEPPRLWHSVLGIASQARNEPDPLDQITKPKVRAAAKALRALKLPQGMSFPRRLEAVNKYLVAAEDGMTITRHPLNEARNALELAEAAAQNCPKLP